jgi:hypothetical protein
VPQKPRDAPLHRSSNQCDAGAAASLRKHAASCIRLCTFESSRIEPKPIIDLDKGIDLRAASHRFTLPSLHMNSGTEPAQHFE